MFSSFRLLMLSAWLLLTARLTHAQPTEPSSDEYLLRATVNEYLTAWVDGDAARLRKLLVPTGSFAAQLEGAANALSREEFVQALRPHQHRLTSTQILEQRYAQDTGSALVQLEHGTRRTTERLSLRKQNGRWYIAAVASTSELIPEQERNLPADKYGRY